MWDELAEKITKEGLDKQVAIAKVTLLQSPDCPLAPHPHLAHPLSAPHMH